MYKIEKNIPVIVPKYGVKGCGKYPLAKMVSGDSFAVPVDPEHYEAWCKIYTRLTVACYNFCKTNYKVNGYATYFAVRKDRKNQVVRVWRL